MLSSLVVLSGLAALCITLIASMPVRFAVQQAGLSVPADRFSGTIRNGAARLDDAHRLVWQTADWESLRAIALVVNWRITGPGTDVGGRLALPPAAARTDVGPVSGRIAWPLVAALLPGLPIRCEGAADLAALRLALTPGARRASGRIAAAPARCMRTDGGLPAVATPALSAVLASDADGLTAVLSAADAPQTPLASARLTDADRIAVTIHAAGAALVPGMPASADSQIELPLAALLP